MHKKIYIIGFIGLLIDQISKFFVDSFMSLNSDITIIDGFFSLRYIRNTGAAWGIMSNNTMLLALISVIFLLFFIKFINDNRILTNLDNISFGLIIGGIVGNLIDRLIRTYVIDFFSFNMFGYHFPVFNVADTLIVVAVILLIIESFIGDDRSDSRRRKKEN